MTTFRQPGRQRGASLLIALLLLLTIMALTSMRSVTLESRVTGNIKQTPIEDASVVWPEEFTPHVTVARLVVPPQPARTAARSQEVDDGMVFSPWHGLAAHRPLGGIMRSRLPAYAMSSHFRSERNDCPLHHPRGPVEL